MSMEITNNYNNYAALAAESSSKAENVKDAGAGSQKSQEEYLNELSRLAPSVKFRTGTSFATAKSGETLTIDPRLLDKMQKDPAKEKEMKELIKGVESMTKLSERLNQASGWKTVFRHSYIDENGNYCHIALTRNEHGYKMSEKLRKERWENSDKLVQRIKEKAKEKKEKLLEELDEKNTEKQEGAEGKKAEEILEQKMSDSEDGYVYMDHEDFEEFLEAVKKEDADKMGTGGNIDLRV